ncbi:MAG TPA: glycosyltransferase, partial [Candidatus Saccharimonadales bacterium]|nr:glycosyltransferase [Candidatus Saccharimonadales bacterium]
RPYDNKQKLAARADWDLPDARRPLLVVTGGGLGARKINQAIVASADDLIDKLGLSIVHITGQADYERVAGMASKNAHYRLLPFVSDKMPELFGSADIVVSRAGATTMLELAAARASVIIVPNPLLTGGHQLKNARVYDKGRAALIVDESKLDEGDLYAAIERLVGDADLRRRIADNLAAFAKPQAAKDVAELILKAAQQ